jgi:hypothetical protein
MKAKWPKEVPILEGRDFCIGTLSAGERHCLLGWAREVFDDPRIRLKANDAVFEAMHKVRPDFKSFRYGQEIAEFNDVPGQSKRILATVWNRAMAKLGYVMRNSECTRTGKLTPLLGK